jgi:prevent-host-death family protein
MRLGLREANQQFSRAIRAVRAGNEVLLTHGHKPVARLVPASETETSSGMAIQIHSLKGHRVLTPSISQSELAEELFGRQ